MMTFDRVLEELVRVCLDCDVEAFDQICVVRDVLGRVHLVTKGDASGNSERLIARLERTLQGTLGGYFTSPVMSAGPGRAINHLATVALENSTEWPEQWPTRASNLVGGSVEITSSKWRAFQRVLSKEVWLSSEAAQPPWPLNPQTPPILSFFSFKGGVGRTTLAALCAATLARDGKRVVAIDLDLEAPGLTRMLGATEQRGTLDYLVDHAATGQTGVTDCAAAAAALPAPFGNNVQVIGCGRQNWSYLEKLARLDYTAGHFGGDTQSVVGRGLRAMLEDVRRELRPDYVLIDSRAGLHDLGGLSLHGSGHVDVLVLRAGPQNYDGFELVLQSLVRRQRGDEFRPLIVHSLAPAASTPEGGRIRGEFTERIYRCFESHYYSKLEEDTPATEDSAAPHFPVEITSRQELLHAQSLQDVELDELFVAKEFKNLMERIAELTLRRSLNSEAEDDGHDG